MRVKEGSYLRNRGVVGQTWEEETLLQRGVGGLYGLHRLTIGLYRVNIQFLKGYYVTV